MAAARGQPRRQATHPERQVVGEDGEFPGRPVRLLRRPQAGALHRGVDDGPGRGPARRVRELGAGVVAVAVQVTGGGAVDANALPRYQVAVGDVVAVEVDGTFVAGGQVEARRVAAGQGPVGRTGGFGRRVGREIRGEPGALREVAVRSGRAGPRADQQKPRERADHASVTHHITAEAGEGPGLRKICFYRNQNRGAHQGRSSIHARSVRSFRRHLPGFRRAPYPPRSASPLHGCRHSGGKDGNDRLAGPRCCPPG